MLHRNTTAGVGQAPAFAPEEEFSASGGANAVTVADIDGDGQPDIITHGSGNGPLVLMRNTAPALTPLQQWKLTHLGNPSASDLGDPDGDGLVTLLEYGLVLLPETPDAASQPRAEFHQYPEGWRLRLVFQRDPARNDITIEVQAAGSPAGPWTTIATSALGTPTTGLGYVSGDSATPGIKTIEVWDTVNFSVSTQRFLRLKITH